MSTYLTLAQKTGDKTILLHLFHREKVNQISLILDENDLNNSLSHITCRYGDLNMKDLHVLLDNETHRNFMIKVAKDNTKASTLLRKWIGRYLKGDLI